MNRLLNCRAIAQLIAPFLGAVFLATTALAFMPESQFSNQLTVKAMSFNIRLGIAKDGDNAWKHRRDLVFDVVAKRIPDFVGLQEAWEFQIEEIREAVPHYGIVGRTRQAELKVGEWCGILYRTDRFEVVESGTLWLSETPEKVASTSWGNTIPRIVTWGLFRVKEGAGPDAGHMIYIYNTHFDHRSQPSREASAKMISKLVSPHLGKHPVVVLGDLNAGEKNDAIKTLKATPLVDSYRVVQPEPEIPVGTFNHWRGEKSGSKIDYVLVDDSATVHSAEIICDHSPDGRYPSDHFPVWAVLEWKL